MNRIILSIISCISFLVFSCSGKNQRHMYLENYFKTNKIEILEESGFITIQVKNSQLIEEQKKLLGEGWINSEAFAAKGALTYFIANQDKKVDSLSISIQYEDKNEKFSYLYDKLKEISLQQNVCKKIVDKDSHVTSKSLKPFLGKEILSAPDSVINAFISNSFSNDKITDIECFAFASRDKRESFVHQH